MSHLIVFLSLIGVSAHAHGEPPQRPYDTTVAWCDCTGASQVNPRLQYYGEARVTTLEPANLYGTCNHKVWVAGQGGLLPRSPDEEQVYSDPTDITIVAPNKYFIQCVLVEKQD